MGLIGNFHCLGMCGPIALAIPLKKEGKYARITSVMIYNSGRILVYTVLGVLFGLLGKGIVLIGFQQHLSILLGVVIVVAVVLPFVFGKIGKGKNIVFSWITKFKALFAKQFTKNSYPAIFGLGMLNGLLPCGLVYVALAGALATGSWHHGAAYMALFGIGTLPIMAILPYFRNLLSINLRKKLTRLIAPTMLLFGILLILRGANLGIPYLSPQQAAEDNTKVEGCCTHDMEHSAPSCH